MFRPLAGSIGLLSLLLAGCAEQPTPATSDFRVVTRTVVEDDRISVWELEIITQQECKLMVMEGEHDRSTVWMRPKPNTNSSGQIVIAASLVPAKESEKGTLTYLSRVHGDGGSAGGPSVYQVDAKDLSGIITVDLQDQVGVFGTPIKIGTVNGNDVTLLVEQE